MSQSTAARLTVEDVDEEIKEEFEKLNDRMDDELEELVDHPSFLGDEETHVTPEVWEGADENGKATWDVCLTIKELWGHDVRFRAYVRSVYSILEAHEIVRRWYSVIVGLQKDGDKTIERANILWPDKQGTLTFGVRFYPNRGARCYRAVLITTFPHNPAAPPRIFCYSERTETCVEAVTILRDGIRQECFRKTGIDDSEDLDSRAPEEQYLISATKYRDNKDTGAKLSKWETDTDDLDESSDESSSSDYPESVSDEGTAPPEVLLW